MIRCVQRGKVRLRATTFCDLRVLFPDPEPISLRMAAVRPSVRLVCYYWIDYALLLKVVSGFLSKGERWLLKGHVEDGPAVF
jgi:uncharacterized RDD family membrane protein YckC